MACYAPWSFRDGHNARPMSCGQCIGCKLRRSKEAAIRCVHEASMHEESCFVMLTFRDRPDWSSMELAYGPYQLFMKRLRKVYHDKRIRFYMCGEYGEPAPANGFTYRGHYHACLFGVRFEDAVYFKKSPSGAKLYRSRILEQLWPHGHCSFGEVSFESAAYVARYCLKKLVTRDGEEGYHDVDLETGEVFYRVPEFARMSLKPGIGAHWFARFHGDVSRAATVISRGKEVQAPLFYRRKLKAMGYRFAKEYLEKCASVAENLPDNVPYRLAAKAAVEVARLNLYN